MKVKFYIALFFAALFLTQCANMVTPTGGPKDVTPPKVTEAVPENHSTNFNRRKVEITFDEYVTLNNASQQVLFSPPLAEKPDIKLSNKTLVIKFKEELRPNTTYTVDFGEAVKDLHEGNLFKDYSYTFSTGDWIDTLTLSGTIVDAETQKPVEKLYVGLYVADTVASTSVDAEETFRLPLQQAPDYLTRTDKEGRFKVRGLPRRKFLVFALDDANANLRYDLSTEKVAFIDSLVNPDDSLRFQLYAFITLDTTQMMLESKLVDEGLLRFAFRHPADSVRIDFPDILPDTFLINKVWSARHDTLCCWFTPKMLDSLRVIVQYDTLIDSDVRYSLAYRASVSRRGVQSQKGLKVTNNLRNNMLAPGDTLTLWFSEPVAHFAWHDTSRLIVGNDTLINDMAFEKADSHGLAYRLAMPINDTVNYVLNLADSVFHSLRGRTNDALTLRFKRAHDTDFGNIFITVAPPEDTQVIVELLDNKGKKVGSQVIDSTARVGFTLLTPDKYKLRAIIDTDRDGYWSTGNFHRRFLPETTVDYPDELDLKAGWDIAPDDPWIID